MGDPEGRKKVLILHENHPDIVGVAKALAGILVANDIFVRVRSAYYDVQLEQYAKVLLVLDCNADHGEYLTARWYMNRFDQKDGNNVTRLYTQTYDSFRTGNKRSRLRHQYETEEANDLLKKVSI